MMRLCTDKAAKRKQDKGQCIVYCCTEKAYKRKGKKRCEKFCHKHHHEHRKEKNPLSYWYAQLRRNAKRRGKKFTITLADFKEFCDKTGYLEKKGRGAGKITVDRVINELGYIPGNLQPLEHCENVRKYHSHYWSRQAMSYKEPPIEVEWDKPKSDDIDIDDLPF